MLQSVSTASIIGMVVSLLVAVFMPIAVCVIWRKRSGAKWSSMLIGAATFILAALIIESLFHRLILGTFGEKLTGNIWIYALYGGICAGVFEETGRLIAMKFCMKKTLDQKNAIMYGIGHGGIEAILIVGISMISNIITAVMINNGQLEIALQVLDDEIRATALEQVSALWTLPSYQFYMGGVERISAFFLHIALSYIVYKAVKDRKPVYYFVAVFLHFLVDAVAVLLAKVLSVLLIEAVLLIFTAILCVFVYKMYSAEKPAEDAPSIPM